MEGNLFKDKKSILKNALSFIPAILLSVLTLNNSATASIGANARCDYVAFLGDSNTNLWYLQPNIALQKPRLNKDYRFTAIIDRKLPIPVYNYGRGGAKTEDMLPGKRYSKWDFRSGARQHGIYVIAFGLNDHKQFKSRFGGNWNLAQRNYWNKTKLLVKAVRARGGTPVLMTMPPVDYPRHHHYDRNAITDKYNTVYRNLSSSLGVTLFDVNKHLKKLIRNNNWDLHIRNTSYTNGKYILDSSNDHGRTNPNWFSNIHYNLNGSIQVANYLTGRLRSMGCGYSSLPSTAIMAEKPPSTPTKKINNHSQRGNNRKNAAAVVIPNNDEDLSWVLPATHDEFTIDMDN